MSIEPGPTNPLSAPNERNKRSPGQRPGSPDVRRKLRRNVIVTLVTLAAALTGAWQVDLVRQNAQILWLTVTGQAWKLQGTVTQYSVQSTALQQSRTVYVYTPPHYATSTSTRYPVLYMLHGAPGLPTDWLRYGRAPEVVERLVIEHKYPPTIIVCPDGQGIGRLGDSEYLDAPSQQRDSEHAPGPGSLVGTFIWQDLPAWVDSHFRTIPDSAHRILAGVSTGGYGAVNLALQHPDVFGAGMSYSGYFQADVHGWARPVWGGNYLNTQIRAESPTLYVDHARPKWKNEFVYVGDGLDERPPYPQQAAAFILKLQAAHINYASQRSPGKHSWDLWRGLLKDALLKYQATRRN